MGHWSTKRPVVLKKFFEIEDGPIKMTISVLPKHWFIFGRLEPKIRSHIMRKLIDSAFKPGKVKKPLRKSSAGSAKRALRHGKNFRTPRGTIRITISTPQRGWIILSNLNYEEWLKIIRDFVGEAFGRIEVKSFYRDLPRGMHKGRKEFEERVRRLASYTCYFVDYLLKNPSSEMKEFAGNLIREFEKDPHNIERSRKGKKKKPKAYKVTAFIMENIFKRERRRHELAPWARGADDFRRTYIDLRRLRAGFYGTRLKNLSISLRSIIQLPLGEDPLAVFRVWFLDIIGETWLQNSLEIDSTSKPKSAFFVA